MRSLVFRFEDITAFSAALGDAQGALALPEGESVADGEWVLAIFEIGSRRRATAAAARGVRASGDAHLEFEARDWERLLCFVAARSEHMRAARPVTTGSTASSGRLAAAPDTSATDDLSRTGERLRHEGEGAPPSSVLESSRVPLGSRVLLIDDDPRTRAEVSAMLAEIGLAVDAVDTAEQAHAQTMDVAYDALVLDFHAQGLDPLDFVRNLRRDPVHAHIPVLVLSQRPSSRDAVEAFACGADDFVPKPFRAPELGARIFGLLRRARLARVSSVVPGGPRSSRGGGSAT